MVFSLTSSVSFREAELIMQKLWQSGDLNTKVVIMVGNKTDLVRTREVPIDGLYFELFYQGTFNLFCPEARFVATSHDCKYVEVSAVLDHNVDTLLVGIVKQIRLKMLMEERSSRYSSFSRYFLKEDFLPSSHLNHFQAQICRSPSERDNRKSYRNKHCNQVL